MYKHKPVIPTERSDEGSQKQNSRDDKYGKSQYINISNNIEYRS